MLTFCVYTLYKAVFILQMGKQTLGSNSHSLQSLKGGAYWEEIGH